MFRPYAWAHQVDQAQQWARSLEDALTEAQQERDQLYETVTRASATAAPRRIRPRSLTNATWSSLMTSTLHSCELRERLPKLTVFAQNSTR
jgi:hypothetical protein